MTLTVETICEAELDKFYIIPAISEKCLENISSFINDLIRDWL